MGGSAFNNPSPEGQPALNIVRLPAALYFELRDRYKSILLQFYDEVATAIEGPDKDSYGDIDILVGAKRGNLTISDLDVALHAVRHLYNGPTTSFAIPIPSSTQIDGERSPEEKTQAGGPQYFQLDVHVCPPNLLAWTTFHLSHGDFWNIIGSSIRRLGLTMNDRGLYARVPEIEATNRKSSFLFLTSDPTEVLQFVGLDLERYRKRFGTAEEMFEYAVRSRFFCPSAYVVKELKHNDRQRMRQRVIYRKFVEEWLPMRRDTLSPPNVTREQVLEEAIQRFNRRQEYDDMMATYRVSQEISEMWSDLACYLPMEGTQLGLALRSLKKWVCDGEREDGNHDVQLQVREEADMTPTLSEKALARAWRIDSGAAKAWVTANLPEIVGREKARIKREKHGREISRENALMANAA